MLRHVWGGSRGHLACGCHRQEQRRNRNNGPVSNRRRATEGDKKHRRAGEASDLQRGCSRTGATRPPMGRRPTSRRSRPTKQLRDCCVSRNSRATTGMSLSGHPLEYPINLRRGWGRGRLEPRRRGQPQQTRRVGRRPDREVPSFDQKSAPRMRRVGRASTPALLSGARQRHAPAVVTASSTHGKIAGLLIPENFALSHTSTVKHSRSCGLHWTGHGQLCRGASG
jgi:hypothetical protein